MPRRTRASLYRDGIHGQFNSVVQRWLEGEINNLVEHTTPAAFDVTLEEYKQGLESLREEDVDMPRTQILNMLTGVLLGVDLREELGARLDDEPISEGGFRTTVGQGQAKNTGMNYENLIVYNLATALEGTPVAVDRGAPDELEEELTINRTACGTDIELGLMGDIAIFRKNDPLDAIILHSKTRWKEVVHIDVMWKLLFDIASDEELAEQWNLEVDSNELDDVLYCFASADSVPPGGRNTQGPDIPNDGMPRNLICADASFFDFVFVSKPDISYTEESIPPTLEREALFHELGAIHDLVEHKFEISLDRS